MNAKNLYKLGGPKTGHFMCRDHPVGLGTKNDVYYEWRRLAPCAQFERNYFIYTSILHVIFSA